MEFYIFVKLIAKLDAKWKKNAKLGEVSFKRLPVSAGNSVQMWNPRRKCTLLRYPL